MSFKEDLLKKIDIDKTTKKILSSIGTPDSGLKIDKNATRHLLDMSPYEFHKERDLDLYIFKIDGDRDKILVLDNELSIYHTTPEDVGLRKSPTIKEMLSIRNARKILNDSDVKISKKEESVRILRKECILLLDLSFGAEDVEEIQKEGMTSLERDYAEGVVESLVLFSELLGYQPVPTVFRLRHHNIYAKIEKNKKGQYMMGPVVIYNKMDNSLKMLEKNLSGPNAEILEALMAVSSGEEEASLQGTGVFQKLAQSIEIKPLSSDDFF